MFSFSFFFFNDTATPEIYTLSLHDALPISQNGTINMGLSRKVDDSVNTAHYFVKDRKSTRLNSSHANISYAVFCLKKKKKIRMKTARANKGWNIVVSRYHCNHSELFPL